MDPKQIFADERTQGMCIYCGDPPDTKDHAPSKVFLDKPYPEDLSIVMACWSCNNGFSIDEEYLSCFVECVVSGTANPSDIKRKKIAQALRRNSLLTERILNSKIEQDGQTFWKPEMQRINQVVEKLARSHLDYELSIQPSGDPIINAIPLISLSKEEQIMFFSENTLGTWPEIGSRAFINITMGKNLNLSGFEKWRCIQPDKYEYYISTTPNTLVRILIRGYLACEAIWIGG